MIKWGIKLKDEDLIEALDIEVTEITKKLAESRKAAMAKLTSGRSQKSPCLSRIRLLPGIPED
jgi:hypothetical protein